MTASAGASRQEYRKLRKARRDEPPWLAVQPKSRRQQVRVLLREDLNGGVSFEYDRPVSMFGQFDSSEIDMVAAQLDKDLRAVLEEAAS